MAIYDTTTSAGLLAYCKFMARRPDSDAEVTDDEWYTLLTEGQKLVYNMIAMHSPGALVGAPVKLTTADNKVFSFPTDVWPMGYVQVRAALGGRVLRIGPEFAAGVDFVAEGSTLRTTNNNEITFADGPYARYVTSPGTLDASTEPTLQPSLARVLIGDMALIQYAHRGAGQRQPAYYESLFQKKWEGNPRVAGDAGIMGMLATQWFGEMSDPLRDYVPWSDLTGYDEVQEV